LEDDLGPAVDVAVEAVLRVGLNIARPRPAGDTIHGPYDGGLVFGGGGDCVVAGPGRVPSRTGPAMKTAVAVESGLCNLICISQDEICFEAMALDKCIK